jgi:phytoene dehydrogenase-like protein
LRVTVLEAAADIGGGTRTSELTLPGFRHDVCSTVMAFAPISPAFRTVPLERYGLRWAYPDVPLAHPLPDGSAVLLHRSIDETAAQFSTSDERAYRRLMAPLRNDAESLWEMTLRPLPIIPKHPVALAKLGSRALWPSTRLAQRVFHDEPARALLAGNAAHAMIPLTEAGSAAAGLMLMLSAHVGGWPFVAGGTQSLANALAAYLRDLGGEILTNAEVRSLSDVPSDQVVLFDTTLRQALQIVGAAWPTLYRAKLRRFRVGAAAYKVDWALNGPIPWSNPDVGRAGTVHLGGPLAAIARAEAAVGGGQAPMYPFVLLTQPSRFDAARAPRDQHTAWVYCHVPNGSDEPMLDRIEAQIERHAPGFRQRVIARHVMGPSDLEAYNPNYIGGDINGGRQDLRQQFMRPVPALSPYRTPDPRLFFCSSSTPPGGGVHGMAGFHAAQAVIRDFGD